MGGGPYAPRARRVRRARRSFHSPEGAWLHHAAHVGHAAAGADALLEGRAGGLQRVLDAVLLPLHLRLGGRADLHDGDAAGELGEALLELLAIEVGVGVLDLLLDLVDAALDGLAVAGAVDDRRVVLRDDDAAGAAELRELRVLELEAHLLGDDLAAGQD